MVRRPAVRDLLARRNAGVPQWPMADLQRFDGTTDLDPADLAAALDADGACIVERLIDTTVTAAIRAELAPHIDLTPNGSDDFTGRNTSRTGGLVVRSPTSRDALRHPLVLGTCDIVLDHVTSYQVHLTQSIAIGPGSPAQPIHRDQWAFDFFPFPDGYEVQCNTIWALTDFTEANGATRVVPGSHRAGPDGELRTKYELEDSIPAEMPEGSVLLYTGSVFHGGGPNTSDGTRIGMNLTYNVGFLRQEENQYLTIPQDTIDELDDDLLRLLGFRVGAYALGYVDDLRDPLDVVRGRSASRGTMGESGWVEERIRA